MSKEEEKKEMSVCTQYIGLTVFFLMANCLLNFLEKERISMMTLSRHENNSNLCVYVCWL